MKIQKTIVCFLLSIYFTSADVLASASQEAASEKSLFGHPLPVTASAQLSEQSVDTLTDSVQRESLAINQQWYEDHKSSIIDFLAQKVPVNFPYITTQYVTEYLKLKPHEQPKKVYAVKKFMESLLSQVLARQVDLNYEWCSEHQAMMRTFLNNKVAKRKQSTQAPLVTQQVVNDFIYGVVMQEHQRKNINYLDRGFVFRYMSMLASEL